MHFSKAQTFSEVVNKLSGGKSSNASLQHSRRASKGGGATAPVIMEEEDFDENQGEDNPEREGKYA